MGAPEAETAQTGVYRGGAVYKCDIAADDRCNTVHFDDKGEVIVDFAFDDLDFRLDKNSVENGIIGGDMELKQNNRFLVNAFRCCSKTADNKFIAIINNKQFITRHTSDLLL